MKCYEMRKILTVYLYAVERYLRQICRHLTHLTGRRVEWAIALNGAREHPRTFPKLLGTFTAQTLAEQYDADPSAADWRRFGRLPGFTNCKPKYRKPDGLFPFVRLHS
jgi:hypothetical protein